MVQCHFIRNNGSRCKRKAKEGKFCWQHKEGGNKETNVRAKSSEKILESCPNFSSLPVNIRQNIARNLKSDPASQAALRRTCKGFKVIPETLPIPPLVLPSGQPIPLKYLNMMKEVKDIILSSYPLEKRDEYERQMDVGMRTKFEDAQKYFEIVEGNIAEISWQNPKVMFDFSQAIISFSWDDPRMSNTREERAFDRVTETVYQKKIKDKYKNYKVTVELWGEESEIMLDPKGRKWTTDWEDDVAKERY
jgi:hypothetical protein